MRHNEILMNIFLIWLIDWAIWAILPSRYYPGHDVEENDCPGFNDI
jgi:hypothetical protein